jgi:hypothetical protein
MNKLAILSLTVMVLAPLSIMQGIPRHVNPNELPEEYPSIVDLLSIYATIMDKALLEDFGGSLRNLNESVKIHVPELVKYVYQRFNELLRDELNRLNSTKKYIDIAKLNILLGMLQYARGNLSSAVYTLAQANLTYIELRQSVDEFEKMLRIPRNQLALKLTSIEKLLVKYFDEIRELWDRLEALRRTGLEETEVYVWVDRSGVWMGESVKLSGFLRSGRGYPLEGRTISTFLDDKKINLLTTDSKGFFSTSISTEGIYKPSIQVYVEYSPSGEDVGRYKASRSNTITIYILYDEPTIYAKLSRVKAYPGQVIYVYGWVNTSLGRLPEKIYMSVFGITLSRSLNGNGTFDFPFRVPESIEEGSYPVRLYTQASGIIAPSEKTLTIFVEKIPINVTYSTPAIVLSGGEVVVIGRVTASVGSLVTPIAYSKVTASGFGSQFTVYSDEDGVFTASIRVPISTMTGHFKVSLFVEPSSQLYRAQSFSVEVFVMNPLIMIAPSIVFAIALVYTVPLVREVRASMISRKTPETIEEYILEIPSIRFFYVEAASVVGEATGIYIRDYETIREYLARVKNNLGEAYQIFEEISMLAERELYGGEPANNMIVAELLRKLRQQLLK